MVSVASQLIEEVTAHAQSDILKDVREICADGTYFPNNLRIIIIIASVYIVGAIISTIYIHFIFSFLRNVLHKTRVSLCQICNDVMPKLHTIATFVMIGSQSLWCTSAIFIYIYT